MRGATPLDAAAASVMDNNELALALKEPDLEKVNSDFVPFLDGTALNIMHTSISNSLYIDHGLPLLPTVISGICYLYLSIYVAL